MRVVRPTPLLREAAEILGPVRDEVLVIGALAVQIALDSHDVALTPTADIDAGSAIEHVESVVDHLERAGLRPSEVEYERSFTWVRGDVKVQLIRPFHPFPKGAAAGLPVNNLVAELAARRWAVAFEEAPAVGVFWAARPAALVALKEAAFGRRRPTGESVDRDFSDVALLLEREGDRIVAEATPDAQLRARVIRAAQRLRDDAEASAAAARELEATGHVETRREGELTARRGADVVLAELAEP